MSKDQTPDKSEADKTDAEQAEQAEPMNRAERRAKGKKSGQPAQSGGRQKFSPKNSSAQGPRLWANRRSG